MWDAMIKLSLLLAVLYLPGCSQGSSSLDSIPPPLQAQTDPAMYGLNVDIRYQGDDSAFTDDSKVYVFLRNGGERMPVAVQYFAVSELPKAVSFSSAPVSGNLQLVTRLSFSGKVDRSPEDIEISQPVTGSHPPQNYSVVLGAGAAKPAAGSWPPDIRSELSASDTPDQSQALMIHTSVAIDASHQFSADTVVFLVARRPGERMPTAVKRLSVADLPASIDLTDADAMAPGSRLSDAAELELFARVSASGSAAASDADWTSEILQFETTSLPETATLLIDAPVD